MTAEVSCGPSSRLRLDQVVARAGRPLGTIHATSLLRGILGCLTLAVGAAGCANSATQPALSESDTTEKAVVVIQAFKDGLSAIRAANPDVKLSAGRDPALADEPVLVVEYPARTDNPAGRDVWCDAENQDWTLGRTISFRAKPDHAVRLSVSFLDRNRVAYTTWTELQGGVWQTVRISFAEIRPNPYFQPPDAKTGAPIDVSEVMRIGFAPQDQAAGRLAISRFVVLK
jgi:hypothetical protein